MIFPLRKIPDDASKDSTKLYDGDEKIKGRYKFAIPEKNKNLKGSKGASSRSFAKCG
ncbi:MAG: hypothetical protein AB8G05_21185 [Oligoflexales bacterium]